MKIKVGDEVSLKNGKVVRVIEQYTATVFRGAHREQIGESLALYRLEDIVAFAGQMNSLTAAEWESQIGVKTRKGKA